MKLFSKLCDLTTSAVTTGGDLRTVVNDFFASQDGWLSSLSTLAHHSDRFGTFSFSSFHSLVQNRKCERGEEIFGCVCVSYVL